MEGWFGKAKRAVQQIRSIMCILWIATPDGLLALTELFETLLIVGQVGQAKQAEQ